MKYRPLNQKEFTCIEQAMVPYGLRNYELQGGSLEDREDDQIIYHLCIKGFNPMEGNPKKFASKIKEALGADVVFIQSVEF